MAEPTPEEKELTNAKRAYITAVRWLKETIGYKALVTGTEWEEDNKAIFDDAKLAFEEAKQDVMHWRKKLNIAKRKLKESKNGRK